MKKGGSDESGSGFLENYDDLQPVGDSKQSLYYENSSADWKQFTKIYIQPVKIVAEDESMSERDQKYLGDYFELAMRRNVQSKYKIATKPGPDTISVRTAIVGIKPAGLLGSGKVTMEGELVDGKGNKRLIAISDAKSGSMFNSFSSWNDMKVAFDEWALQLYRVLSDKMGEVQQSTSMADRTMNDVEQLLKAADNDYRANRLTTPVGNNAYELYRQLLDLYPGNEAANTGIDKIVGRYVAWGDRALADNRIPTAWYYLDKARNLHEDNEDVQRLAEALRARKAGGTSTSYARMESTSFDDDSSDEDTSVSVAVTPPPMAVVAAPVVTAEVKMAAPAKASKYALTVKTNPKNAKVKLVDSKQRYKAGIKLAPGNYRIQVDAKGYDSESQLINLSQNKTIKITLHKKEVAFDPWGGNPGGGSADLNGSKLKPFVLGLETKGDIKAIVKAAVKRLKANGFEIAGQYSPYNDVDIIVVTNGTLKKNAAKSEYGGYGAIIRVSITQVGERVQVSYANPNYINSIYRMSGNLSGVGDKLATALGKEKIYGSKKGIKSKSLRDWHYMFGMPYFDDQIKLASHGSQKAAVSKVEANLKAKKGGVSKVYRVDVSGKDEAIFGVAIKNGAGSDSTVMKSIDVGSDRHSAHLPYDILVSGGKVYTLSGKFRIALSFPDLTMKQFMGISSAPDAIEKVLKGIAK